MKLKPSALALLGLLSASGCGDGGSAEPTPSLSNQARLYLNQLMRYMEDYSINRLTIDWGRFRTSVLEVAGAAQTIPETYPAIRLALELLGDGHSSFRTP